MHWINNYSFLLMEVLLAHQGPYCSLLSALSPYCSPLGISPTSNDFPFIPAVGSEYYSTDSQTGDWCRFLLLRLLKSAKEHIINCLDATLLLFIRRMKTDTIKSEMCSVQHC